jgi:hypothetical protein
MEFPPTDHPCNQQPHEKVIPVFIRILKGEPFMHKTILSMLAITVLHAVCSVRAETDAAPSADAAQANNPLANMKALNFHNYYIPSYTEPAPDSGNQFWLRYAQPMKIGNTMWLNRASLPITGYSNPDEFGLGDFNIFSAYLIPTKNPAVSFGIGPQLTVPTATATALGTDKWSAGLANILFDGRSKKIQYGYLLTWQHSFAGKSDARDVNLAAFQYFVFYQLRQGWYLRSAPIWAFDLETDSFTIPIGLGAGKVVKKGSVVYNAFVEPQVSVADKGPSPWPEWQIFFALNLQFIGR